MVESQLDSESESGLLLALAAAAGAGAEPADAADADAGAELPAGAADAGAFSAPICVLWNLEVTALTAQPAHVDATSLTLGLALAFTSASTTKRNKKHFVTSFSVSTNTTKKIQMDSPPIEFVCVVRLT